MRSADSSSVGDSSVEEETTTTGSLQVLRNRTAGNLQVFKNLGAAPKFVQGNLVQQEIQCKENALPFTGGPNTAGGREGQCF